MKNDKNTKEKFIETACKLFEVKGYNATGLNEILKESGAPKGSLYYHFPKGKEQLALESIKLAGKKITNNLKRTLDMFESPTEGIICNINNMAKIIDDNRKMEDVSISLIALETYISNETLRKACEQIFDSIEKIYVEKLIKYGINENRANDIAVSISAMVEGAIMLSLTRKNGNPLRKITNNIPMLTSK